jgi:hypothetical protein
LSADRDLRKRHGGKRRPYIWRGPAGRASEQNNPILHAKLALGLIYVSVLTLVLFQP